MKKIFTLYCLLLATCTLWAQNNVIVYTATEKLPEITGLSGSGLHMKVFNDSIVSHTFVDSTRTGIITFASDVTSIGTSAFAGCSGLASITISSSVTSIKGNAFSGCTGLTSIICLPHSPPSLGVLAFSMVPSNIPLYVPTNYVSRYQSATTWSSFNVLPIDSLCAKNNALLYRAAEKITETLERGSAGIRSHAFGAALASHIYFDDIGIIMFAGSVTTIGDSAFYHCEELYELTIPNSVKSIGDCAFIYCSGLTAITISDFVTSIGTYAFGDCHRVSSIDLGHSVANIGNGAFCYCMELTTLTIPPSVTSIGDYAFSYCPELLSIAVDPANPTYDSRENCNAIIESATNTLITGCQNTTIPSSVSSIGNGAFVECVHLTSINIPSFVTSIAFDAFRNCVGLTAVHVTDIAAWCGISFGDYCTPLYYANQLHLNGELVTNLVVPKTVTNISAYAFSGCTSLNSITISSTVTGIGQRAFFGCSQISSITSHALTPPTLGDDAFASVPTDIPLYVPENSIPAYQAADQWNAFDIQPLLVELDSIRPDSTHLTWLPVDSASLYKLRIYSDQISLDTTLIITADPNNGGIMAQSGVSHRLHRITLDDIGSVVVISIDSNSGTSETEPFVVSVSTTSENRIDIRYEIKVYNADTALIRQEEGMFSLNEDALVYEAIDILPSSGPAQPATVLLRNGQLLLRRGDALYTLQGQRVE